MRPRPRRLAAIPLLLAILVAPQPSAEGRPGSHSHVRTLAPGVTLRTMIDARVPVRTFVVTVDPSQGARIEGLLVGGELGVARPLTTTANGAGALAAINGDYKYPGTSLAVHPLVENGEFVRSASEMGGAFVLHRDGSASIGKPAVSVSVTEQDTGETWPIARWNTGDPAQGELAAFTDRGGAPERTPPFSCAARLQGGAGGATTATYQVETVGCFTGSLGPQGGVVLAARPGTDEAAFLTSLTVGEPVTVDWSVGFDDVRDMIGGFPLLLQDGKPTVTACSQPICGRQPRTAIGVTAEGVVLLVVVDGREAGYSVGMTLIELATFLRSLGAVDATNFDGGGSSTMVVQGDLINRPSDGQQRPAPTAILVLPS